MKIKINQTLHGYGHGHQLLSASLSLPSEVKEVLLIQSDLSGSNIDKEFKEYITGYPLSNNKYAFAKTWYADEMKRPGCVWTHTLLIDFSDLGKIPDFEKLLVLFSRPEINNYSYYQSLIEIDAKELITKEIISENKVNSRLLKALYDDYDSSILVPANSSKEFEKNVIQIWSNQWPRLRRNFTFCTGALNIKLLEGKEYDLQIIPDRNINTVGRKSSTSVIIDDESVYTPWLNIIYNSSKNNFRRFLWVYGSDVAGIRKNFKPLVLLYAESIKEKKTIPSIINILDNYFPDAKEGELLKLKIFSDENIFDIKQPEVLDYLLTAETIPVGDLDKLNIQSRIIEEYKNENISLEDFLKLFISAKPNRISKNIWQDINLSEKEIISLILKDHSLLELFVTEIATLAEQPFLWQHSYDLQLDIYNVLRNQHCNWQAILFAALDASSKIVTQILNDDGQNRVIYLFEWQRLKNSILPNELGSSIFNRFKSQFFNYVRSNVTSLSQANCYELFNYNNSNEIISLNLSSPSWISIYKKVTDERLKVYASCVFLSMAFNRKVEYPETLIPICFGDVYVFAKQSKIKDDLWRIIPKDLIEENEPDNNPFSFFLDFFTPTSKQISKIRNWDYCEMLIRTLSNKFIKSNWSKQCYIDSMTNNEIFSRCIGYCLNFKKGIRFLNEIAEGISKGNVKISDTQRTLFKKLLE